MPHHRLHSAGHLLDAAMRCAGREDLVPTKGYHFPDGNAYVEYDGNVAAEEREILAQALTVKAQELVDAGTAVEVNVEANDDGGGGTYRKRPFAARMSVLGPNDRSADSPWPVLCS